MAITETIKNLLGKVLSLGTPPEKKVLYKEVIKRKAPKESAEKLMINDIKNSVKKVFSTSDGIEFSRGAPTPPVKKVAKKKTPAKKTASKKSTTTKKKVTPAKKTTTTKKKTTAKTKATETKTTTAKKSPTKKTVSKKVVDKKIVTKKSPDKKATVKKESTKKVTTSTSKKTTTTSTKKPATKKPVSKKVSETKSTTVKKKPTKKATEKKISVKSANTKTVIEKKVTVKKKVAPTKKLATTKKSTTAAKGSKRDEKIALYIEDIKKHYGEVDEAFVAIIVKNLGPSIYRRDAELVSCSDPKELDTVRKNFLIKKLGIEASQGVLDAAIQDVCTELKGVRTKYRATFYYSLAKKFKKESVLK